MIKKLSNTRFLWTKYTVMAWLNKFVFSRLGFVYIYNKETDAIKRISFYGNR